MSGMLIVVEEIIPVSYTHLDVYKRQAVDNAVFMGCSMLTGASPAALFQGYASFMILTTLGKTLDSLIPIIFLDLAPNIAPGIRVGGIKEKLLSETGHSDTHAAFRSDQIPLFHHFPEIFRPVIHGRPYSCLLYTSRCV